MGGDTIKNKLR